MENKKVALITGITGQDGSYLAELLLEKGYEVHGIIRRASTFNTKRIDHLYQDPHEENVRLFLHYGDITDSSNLNRLIEKIRPNEIYNLAAQSHVGVSFDSPEYTAEATGVSTLRILDAIRESGVKTKFYQASTSELFGGLPDTAPQSEKTPFYPKSPYGVAKLYSYWITVNYRESYDIFACNGILFNHESPRRGETFVTRKITRAAAAIHLGMQDKLYLGNLDAKRDWGHAKDYVEGMWRILQQDKPQDYVLAMNETHTVREFVELAFAELGYEIEWQGSGVDEKGIDKNTGRVLVEVDPRYFRPAEVELLWGDSTKARTELTNKLLNEVKFDVIRGNISEIKFLGGLDVKGKGVDSFDDGSDATYIVREVAKKLECVVVASGKTDLISHKEKIYKIHNGSAKLKFITGTGCMSTSLIGSFLACTEDKIKAAIMGTLVMSLSGELADRENPPVGTFKTKLFDNMFTIDEEVLNKYAKIEKVQVNCSL